MKKIILISLMILSINIIFSEAVPLPRTGIVHETNWQDGYESVYLYQGTYHFVTYALVSTYVPFLPGNLWINRGIIEGVINWSAYGEAFNPCVEYWFNNASNQFTIEATGWYNVKIGAYQHYGVNVISNIGKLVCDYTPVHQNDE